MEQNNKINMKESMMDQLSQLPMGEIAKRTKEFKGLLLDIKHMNRVNATIRKHQSAQDVIDSTDTKIRSPHFR